MKKLMIALILCISFASFGFGQVGPPKWEPGDSWGYWQRKIGNVSFRWWYTFVGQSAFQGHKSLKVVVHSYDHNSNFIGLSHHHFSSGFFHLGVEKEDGSIDTPTMTLPKIKWPLHNKKQWQDFHYEPWLEAYVTSNYSVALEKVTVPAGIFDSFRIKRVYSVFGRDIKSVHWYSPSVKNWIKTIDDRSFIKELLEIKKVK